MALACQRKCYPFCSHRDTQLIPRKRESMGARRITCRIPNRLTLKVDPTHGAFASYGPVFVTFVRLCGLLNCRFQAYWLGR